MSGGLSFAGDSCRFADYFNCFMARKKNIFRVINKWLAGLVYLSFFLVQFNVHFGPCSRKISYFSSDYSSVNNSHFQKSGGQSLVHKDTKHSGFKFNKRFHPEKLLAAPVPEPAEVYFSYHIVTALIREDQPLTQFSFNSPSLRGPPAIV